MLHTTYNLAKEARVCTSSLAKMVEYKGGVKKWGADTPVPLGEVLKVCGLDDALWCLRAIIEPADKEIRLFACDCAERVLPIFEKAYPKDKRPRQAIEVSRRFALGQATKEELEAAWEAARATLAAAGTAWEAARVAAWEAARAAALEAARVAAREAERQWQKERFLELLNKGGKSVSYTHLTLPTNREV